MQELIGGLKRALFLMQRYGLDDGALREALREMEEFYVTVPVIGSFNTGKSAMLNALMGMRLLPEGIEATTLIPTELLYGENGVTVSRGDFTQRMGLGELRCGGIDLQGVSLLRVCCDAPFLRRIESIKLVDMPGLDSLLVQPEQAMRRCLSNSLAYLLVFPADEPVVKQSVAAFLSELRLSEIPVFIVLTKCDKVTPGELAQAKDFLRQNMLRLFGLKEAELCCVSARQEVDEVADVLLRLQRRAGEIRRERAAAHLREAGLALQSYLSMRVGAAQIPVSELESRSRMLEGRMTQLQGMLGEEQQRFHSRVAAANTEQMRRMRLDIGQAAGPIADLLASGQNPAEFVEGLLSGAVAAAIANSFEPPARRCLKRVLSLLRMYRFSQAAEPSAPAFAALQQLAGQRRLIVGSAEGVDSRREVRPLFSDVLRRSEALARGAGRREAFCTSAAEELMPRLISMAEQSAKARLQEGVDAVCRAIDQAVEQEYRMLQQAMEDARAAQRPAEFLRQTDLTQLNADLASAARLLCLCGEPKDSETGGDALDAGLSEDGRAAAHV